MLSDKIEGYKNTGKFPMVTPARYKKDYPYLKEVDSLAIANKQFDLQEAFRNRFSKSRKAKSGFPKFKSATVSQESDGKERYSLCKNREYAKALLRYAAELSVF